MAQETSVRFSSQWGFILAAVGAAVGLGNIWRFPYMAGMQGGSAFVLLYILFVVLIGAPVMLAEIVLGRLGRKNPIDSLKDLAVQNHKSPLWAGLGGIGALCLVMVLSFYSVVAGWAIAYLFYALGNTFSGLESTQIHAFWTHFMAQPIELSLWHGLFMTLVMGVVSQGVKEGVEKATTWMMPALYALLFFLVGYAAWQGNFTEAVNFLLTPRWEQIHVSVVLAALGHAFFTLAVGAGAILAYGAYVKKEVPLFSSVTIIVGLDVLVALLSGLAIFPLVFLYHLEPASGPGLMFQVLPIVFGQLSAGRWIGAAFFLLMLFAAWTAALNMTEPLIMILHDRFHLSRRKACWIVGSTAWVLGLGSVLSFNRWEQVHFFGHWTFFDCMTNIPMEILLPFGGLGFAWFIVWVLRRSEVKALFSDSPPWLTQTWLFLLKWVVPVGVLSILAGNLFKVFQDIG